MIRNVSALVLGVLFGVVLVKSEVASWFRIDTMFRFGEARMYLIICSAIGVALVSAQLVKRLGLKTVDGGKPEFKNKPFTKGTIIGGTLFGIGWAIIGACPGPIYAQLGVGEWYALASFAGAFAGAYLYAWLKPRLPH